MKFTLRINNVQALKKRSLPRVLMSNNGAAMTFDEFMEGLERLGILYKLTLHFIKYNYVTLCSRIILLSQPKTNLPYISFRSMIGLTAC